MHKRADKNVNFLCQRVKSREHESEKTNENALRLSDWDVGHRERGEDDRVLVRVGVGGGDKVTLRWLRVSQHRGGVSQDDVLSRGSGLTELFTERGAADQSYDLWRVKVKRRKRFFLK